MFTKDGVTKSMIAAGVLAATIMLSGCFANPVEQITDKIASSTAEDGAEKLIKDITGSDIDVETGGELPADFPQGVPLADGTIQMATSVTLSEGRGWMVVISVEDSAAALNTAREELVAAGFAESAWQDQGEMKLGIFQSDTLNVIMGAMPDADEGDQLSYQVSELAPEG